MSSVVCQLTTLPRDCRNCSSSQKVMNFHERFGGISRGGGNSHMTGLLVRDFEKKSYEVPARRFCRCGLIFFHSVEVPILKQDINWHWLFLHPILWKVKAKAISGGPLRLNILRIISHFFKGKTTTPPRSILYGRPLREKKCFQSFSVWTVTVVKLFLVTWSVPVRHGKSNGIDFKGLSAKKPGEGQTNDKLMKAENASF